MRALITRPAEDAAPLAEALKARGIDSVVEPMLSIKPVKDPAIALDGAQAILFTSSNGVRGFAEHSTRRDLPVFTVGDTTAALSRSLGFTTVKSAGGDSAALARLVAAELDPKSGALVHARGRDISAGLGPALESAGFELRSPVVYRAVPTRALSDELRRALTDGTIELALFFSPRTARSFVTLLQEAKLGAAAEKVTAICLSRAVATALAPLAWRATVIADKPSQDSLLAALDAQLAPNRATPAAPASQPPSATGRATPRWVWALAVVAVVALAAAGAALWLSTRQAGTGADTRVATLESDLARLRARIDAQPAAGAADPDLARRLETVERATASVTRSLTETSDRLAALDDKASRLAQRPDDTAALQEASRRLDALEQRLAALEQRAARDEREGGRGAALVVAVSQLGDAMRNGKPYDRALKTIATLGRDDANVQKAVAALGTGEASRQTIADLARGFPANAIVQAARAPEGAGWLDRALARLSALVSVRRVGADVEGDAPDAIAARAEARLAEGKLPAAIAEVEKLQGAPAEAARSWLGEARMVQTDREILDALSAYVVRQFGESRAAPSRE